MSLETLERAGRLEATRGALIDDCSVARLLKQHGGRLWIGLTEQSHSLRQYETFSDIEHMVSRTAFNQLNHSSLLLVCAIAGMVITYLAPPLLLLPPSASLWSKRQPVIVATDPRFERPPPLALPTRPCPLSPPVALAPPTARLPVKVHPLATRLA